MTLERPMFPPRASRRGFLALTAAASAVSAGSLAVAAMPPLQACAQDDSALLALEEKFFEQKELADSYDDEINRLAPIWHAESGRLYDEALREEILTGKFRSPEERWALVTNIPECIEHDRLDGLQAVHFNKMDEIIREMWATPAHTPEGRRAKVLVALNLLPSQWRVAGEADYGIHEVRQLLIEFVGGEPGEQLRDQFA